MVHWSVLCFHFSLPFPLQQRPSGPANFFFLRLPSSDIQSFTTFVYLPLLLFVTSSFVFDFNHQQLIVVHIFFERLGRLGYRGKTHSSQVRANRHDNTPTPATPRQPHFNPRFAQQRATRVLLQERHDTHSFGTDSRRRYTPYEGNWSDFYRS